MLGSGADKLLRLDVSDIEPETFLGATQVALKNVDPVKLVRGWQVAGTMYLHPIRTSRLTLGPLARWTIEPDDLVEFMKLARGGGGAAASAASWRS